MIWVSMDLAATTGMGCARFEHAPAAVQAFTVEGIVVIGQLGGKAGSGNGGRARKAVRSMPVLTSGTRNPFLRAVPDFVKRGLERWKNCPKSVCSRVEVQLIPPYMFAVFWSS